MRVPQRYVGLSIVELNENCFFYISDKIVEEFQIIYDLIITTSKMLNIRYTCGFYDKENVYLFTFNNMDIVYIQFYVENDSNIFKEVTIESFSTPFVKKLKECIEGIDSIKKKKSTEYGTNCEEGCIELLKSFLKCI